MTALGILMGTKGYMAPEQFEDPHNGDNRLHYGPATYLDIYLACGYEFGAC
jgi:hypothetical protein